MAVQITFIPLSDVEKNEANYNSNNHTDLPWDEPLLAVSQYDEILQRTKYSIWKDILTDAAPTGYSVWLGQAECQLLLEACESGMFTGRIPSSVAEDIDQIVTPKIPLPRVDSPTLPKYFVRLDECSTKDGVGGIGPFTTADAVVKALCTSKRTARAFKRSLRSSEVEGNTVSPTGTYLHLLPWREFNADWEFRAFVAPGERGLVGLSQYSWKKDVGWSEPKRKQMLQPIVSGVQDVIKQLTERANAVGRPMPAGYVLDVHVREVHANGDGGDGEGQPSSGIRMDPIELNSFGAQMGAGSALFHWIKDHERLYGFLDGIEVRVVGSE
ncbi:hypothetical protein HK104_006046 [Borealophlyctis nickersoniae]|nr:hypothetical protein HK104_006046 [Borealophlyctis nickersoniae]